MKKLIFLYLFAIPHFMSGQVYLQKQSQHRFAQLTLGLETQYIPKGGTALLGEQPFPAMYLSKFHIGGTHFWGHTEFYVSFPITNFGEAKLEPQNEFFFSPGIETGAKVYPWRIEKNKIRPYLGAAYAIYDFRWSQQEESGDLQSKSYIPLHLGATLQLNNHLLNLGITYSPFLKDDYYYTRTDKANYRINPWSLQFGWKYQLETTLGLEYEESKGNTKSLYDRFMENNSMSAFSLAIGPSSAFIVGFDKDNFNAENTFLTKHTGVGIFPEFGLGYYYYPWDMHVNLSYRANSSTHKAFGFTQSISRSALTLEAYKFLFDYHGFVPFIGPSISYGQIQLMESNEQEITDLSTIQWNPGITFGWDIRPNNVQHWILRTNLRYTPIRWNVEENRQLVFDQLEFNFIQLIIYPQRWFQRIKWKKEQFPEQM